jgi:Arc/MetJ-type ribon-helix-helix transcriptional regulator
MPDDLPESSEALRAKIRDLEKESAANREEIAALKKRLDDLDSEIIDESEGDDAGEDEPWA